MKKDKKTKKNSAMKKLVPATGMLLVSAIMLTTSTYAWFTMSREVEVKGIQMTATVPEDIQISLGKIGTTSNAATASTNTANGSVAMNTGFLMNTDNVVTAPREDGVDNNDIDWANSVDVSAYYGFGKLIPASSINGEDIIFTPDANGVGKTVKSTAKFYQAANAITAQNETGIGTNPGSGKFNATAHVYTSATDRSTTWSGTTYSAASAWNHTNDDGYYIDIPVWLRTSSASVDVGVQAYVVDVAATDAANPLAVANGATAAGEKLYKAVRVAVLDGTAGTAISNLIPVADGDGTLSTAGDRYTGTSVLDWYTRSASTNPDTNANAQKALKSTGPSNAGEYDTPVTYAGATTSVATLTGGSGTAYGTAVKRIIRVWIEGEDPDCWNETAGQDWSINLKFVKTGDATAPSNSTPAASTYTKTVTFKDADGSAADTTETYTYTVSTTSWSGTAPAGATKFCATNSATDADWKTDIAEILGTPTTNGTMDIYYKTT